MAFSYENDVVRNDEWANLREENGLDGGDTSHCFSNESTQKMSRGAQKRNEIYWKSEKGKEQKQRYSGDGNVAKREEVRKKISENNPMKREENKKIHSERMKRNNPMKKEDVAKKVSDRLTGRTLPAETKDKISSALSGENHWNFGNERPDSVKQKIRETLLSRPMLTCLFCGLMTRSKSNYERYHNERCKKSCGGRDLL